MIFSIPTLIEHVSSIMKLEVGDVILTGNRQRDRFCSHKGLQFMMN